MSEPTVFEQLQWTIHDQTEAKWLEAEKAHQDRLAIAKLQNEYAMQSIQIDELDMLQQAQAFCGLLALIREVKR